MIFRKIFRYRLTSIYFILSQIIVYFAVFGALQIYDQAYAKEQDRLSAFAKNRIQLEIATLSQFDMLSSAAQSVSVGNVIAAGSLTAQFLEAGASTKCEVLLQVNENLQYPLIWGRMPGLEESDSGKRLVALGKDKFKYAYERDGTYYVNFNQEEYEVTGVIGTTQSDYWDYKIVFAIDCIGEKLRAKFAQEQSYIIELSSNYHELTDSYYTVFENIKNIDQSCNIVPYQKNSTGDSTVATTLAQNNIKINWIVYIFCLLNSMIMSVFFIVQRRKEFAIKKAFGMNNMRIILELAGNILVLSLFSFLIFLILYMFWNYIFLKEVNLVQLDLFNIAVTITGMFLSVLVTLIYPIYQVFHRSAAISIGGDY